MVVGRHHAGINRTRQLEDVEPGVNSDRDEFDEATWDRFQENEMLTQEKSHVKRNDIPLPAETSLHGESGKEGRRGTSKEQTEETGRISPYPTIESLKEKSTQKTDFWQSNQMGVESTAWHQSRTSRDSGSLPTQVVSFSDHPSDQLQNQFSTTSINFGVDGTNWSNESVAVEDNIIGIGCFSENEIVWDPFSLSADGMQEAINMMSQEQSRVQEYTPNIFFLLFLYPRSYAEAVIECLRKQESRSQGNNIVNAWLLVLFTFSKVLGLIFSTELYLKLQYGNEGAQRMSQLDLTGQTKYIWFDPSLSKFNEHFDRILDPHRPKSRIPGQTTNADHTSWWTTEDSSGADRIARLVEVAQGEDSATSTPASTSVGGFAQRLKSIKQVNAFHDADRENKLKQREGSRSHKPRSRKLRLQHRKCDICGKVYRLPADLEHHIDQEHPLCEFCDRRFNNSSELINHFDVKHQFVCYYPLCKKRSFLNQQELSNHLEVLHPEEEGSSSVTSMELSIHSDTDIQSNGELTEQPASETEAIVQRRGSSPRVPWN